MIVAVVPAAGRSERMGRPKLALPLGGVSVLERVVTALHTGGAARVVVVLAPHVADLAGLAEAAGADVRLLDAATPDMRATVEAGLNWIERHVLPLPDAWLLAPADQPTLSAVVVRQLIQERTVSPTCSVFVPSFGGRRGHPTLIDWRHVVGIRAHPSGEGLNTYLRRFAAETRMVPVDDEGVLADLDTPADYERLRKLQEPEA
jgi:molybdenum cofactor cytidylyltransferase